MFTGFAHSIVLRAGQSNWEKTKKMVLSNKKLKRKLRDELAKSLSASATGSGPNNSKPTNSDTKPQPQSLKELLDTVSHNPRLSKREKRRKSLNLRGLDGSSNENSNKKEVESLVHGENGGRSEEIKTKKRKRDDIQSGESGGDEKGDGVVKEGTATSKKQKKDKKKKKKKNKKRMEKNEGENPKSEVLGIMENRKNIESQADGVIPGKVYVGGIPYHYMEDEIRSYFKGCGAITEVDCKMRSEDGKFSGIAFLTFETEDAAHEALSLDRAAMGDRFLTIQQYVRNPSKITSDFAPEMVEGYNRIYIGNLPWDATEYDVRKLFSDCVITKIRFGTNKETGEFKGYAHVDFKDGVSTAMALKLDQQIVCGRPVKISCAVPKKSANTGSRSDEADNDIVYAEETNIDPKSVAVINEANNGGSSSAVSSGKIRRRTCYECGEKGHLSSACPKKQSADMANSNTA